MFVSLEGIDGAGKTTIVRLLHRQMTKDGLPALLLCKDNLAVSDPYVSKHISRLRALIWPKQPDDPQYKLGDHHFLFLLAAWFRAVDQHIIRPNLQSGRIIVTDGWIYKTLARNSLRSHIDRDLINNCFAGLSKPTMSFLLEISPEVAATRKKKITNAESGINDGSQVGGVAGFLSYQRDLSSALEQTVCEHLSNVTHLDGLRPLEDNVAVVYRLLVAGLRDQIPKIGLV